MIRNTFLFVASALLISQLCQADSVDDAEAALNALREATSTSLTNGFMGHIELSLQVDTAALDTKAGAKKIIQEETDELVGALKKIKASTPAKVLACHKTLHKLAKKAADDIETCVNEAAEAAVDYIADSSTGLATNLLKIIYEYEKSIIFCGRGNDVCLTQMTTAIEQQTAAVDSQVSEQIAADGETIEQQIADIKACAAKAAEKAKSFAKSCVH